MSYEVDFLSFEKANASEIQALVAEIVSITQEAELQLVKDMKRWMTTFASEYCVGDGDAQADAIAAAEGWVSEFCTDNGLERNVAMALFLYGREKGTLYLQNARKCLH